MKMFVVASISIVIISMIFGMSYEQFVVIGLLLIFGALITIYKHIDLECLYEIGIRYAYDQCADVARVVWLISHLIGSVIF